MSGGAIFVVQKHDATNLHYDFRLEAGGALKSWAVPKGPSLDPSQKRLAIRTEDHKISYADFEGVIPEDEYGAGKVIVWDKGTYKNLRDEPFEDCVEKGHASFELSGEKLKGGFSLVRTGGKGKSSKWLLIKKDDKHASSKDILSEKPDSVISGKSVGTVSES